MRQISIAALFAAGTCLILCGCGSPEDKFVGTYEGEYHASQRELNYWKNLPKQEVDAFVNQKVNLVLHKDKTAVFDYVSAEYRVRGFWQYQGAQIHVTYKQPGPRSEHFTVSNDFKTLTQGHWVFNKVVN